MGGNLWLQTSIIYCFRKTKQRRDQEPLNRQPVDKVLQANGWFRLLKKVNFKRGATRSERDLGWYL